MAELYPKTIACEHKANITTSTNKCDVVCRFWKLHSDVGDVSNGISHVMKITIAESDSHMGTLNTANALLSRLSCRVRNQLFLIPPLQHIDNETLYCFTHRER